MNKQICDIVNLYPSYKYDTYITLFSYIEFVRISKYVIL